MASAHALIVDDEADIRELLEITLGRMGLRTEAAATLAEAKDLLDLHSFDLCLTDMRLPDGDGIMLVEYIQKHCDRLPVAVLTAYGNAHAAVRSLKAGAFDYVSKPVDLQSIRKLVDTALKLRGATPEEDDGGLLGTTPSIIALREMVGRLSRSQAPVHVSGESGTGKELVARLIHARGPRADGPFVAVNCGAIPTELMESEFFGHLKGSFTGATRDKAGLFVAAEGGTLFLDEVGELPLHMQVKLLRALQERAVRPVGAETEVAVNARIISATHRDLGALVTTGAFRQDLYYRLNVIEIRTPPLREHPQDIPLLAAAILQRLAAASGYAATPKIDPQALDMLESYPFPGNVRELENVIERALTLSDGVRLRREDLQLRAGATVHVESAAAVGVHGNAMGLPLPDYAGAAGNADLEAKMESIERQAITDALEKARFNKTKAAALLGMSFRQLRYRIKKLNIE